MPILYLGTLFGVQVGSYLSETALAISLGAVLLFVSVKTMQKAIDTYRKENEKKRLYGNFNPQINEMNA